LAILTREVLVSGLREFLSEIKVSVPVSNLSKVKTFFQMLALFILILGNNSFKDLDLEYLGNVVLWISATLTVFTGYIYFKKSLKHIGEG
ncbi:MAG: CDP-alcohol phosphatidyltransferase family protein, partial [Rickettsiales bacterium]